MQNYLELGSTPCDEECAQVGEEYYAAKSLSECSRFIKCIRITVGNEPSGAKLQVKSFQHEFGLYYEVVCYYDESNEASAEYAFKCESDGPTTWCDK